MTAMPVKERMTADEYLALPLTPETRRLQLVNGELVVTEPSLLHGTVQIRVLYALETWVRKQPARGRLSPPIDVRLNQFNVFAPDVCWYTEARKPGLHDPRPYACPDLVAEVRSPSTWRYDIGAKKSAYERHGLPELWLLDTAAHEVLVFRRGRPDAPTFDVALELDTTDTLISPLLPGFALSVDELFAAD